MLKAVARRDASPSAAAAGSGKGFLRILGDAGTWLRQFSVARLIHLLPATEGEAFADLRLPVRARCARLPFPRRILSSWCVGENRRARLYVAELCSTPRLWPLSRTALCFL